MTAVFAFLIMLLIVAGMSVGVMMGRKPIAGSCGGMKALGLDTECEVCGGKPGACDSAGTGRGRGAEAATSTRADATGLAANAVPERGGRDVRTL